MGKQLVLAEKPSVARDIARVLGCKGKGDGCIIGDKYIITWALGHLVTLADPDAYDDKYKRWELEDLPMLPEKMKLVKNAMLAVQRYPWEQGVCAQAVWEMGDTLTAVAMAHDAVLRQTEEGRLAVIPNKATLRRSASLAYT